MDPFIRRLSELVRDKHMKEEFQSPTCQYSRIINLHSVGQTCTWVYNGDFDSDYNIQEESALHFMQCLRDGMQTFDKKKAITLDDETCEMIGIVKTDLLPDHQRLIATSDYNVQWKSTFHLVSRLRGEMLYFDATPTGMSTCACLATLSYDNSQKDNTHQLMVRLRGGMQIFDKKLFVTIITLDGGTSDIIAKAKVKFQYMEGIPPEQLVDTEELQDYRRGTTGEHYKEIFDGDGCDFNTRHTGDKTFYGKGSEIKIALSKPKTLVTLRTPNFTDGGEILQESLILFEYEYMYLLSVGGCVFTTEVDGRRGIWKLMHCVSSFAAGFSDGEDDMKWAICFVDMDEYGDYSLGAKVERYNGVCDEHSCDFNTRCTGDKAFYGKGSSFNIDTLKPTLVTQLYTHEGTDDGGVLQKPSMHFVNEYEQNLSVGDRVYVLDGDGEYYMWKLGNRVYTLTEDIVDKCYKNVEEDTYTLVLTVMGSNIALDVNTGDKNDKGQLGTDLERNYSKIWVAF